MVRVQQGRVAGAADPEAAAAPEQAAHAAAGFIAKSREV